MKKPTVIGLKFSAIGFISWILIAFFLVKVMDDTISAGFGVGIWVAMILLCSAEAYKQGMNEQKTTDKDS